MRALLLLVLLTIPEAHAGREIILRKSPDQQQTADLRDARRARLEIAAAMLELKDLYPDFEAYAPRILELSDAFLPGKTVSARNYLEGLYFIAKHTTSQAEHTEAGASGEPAKAH